MHSFYATISDFADGFLSKICNSYGEDPDYFSGDYDIEDEMFVLISNFGTPQPAESIRALSKGLIVKKVREENEGEYEFDISTRARVRFFDFAEATINNSTDNVHFAAPISTLWELYTRFDELKLFKSQEEANQVFSEVEKILPKLTAEEIDKIHDLDKKSLKSCLEFISEFSEFFTDSFKKTRNFLIEVHKNSDTSKNLKTANKILQHLSQQKYGVYNLQKNGKDILVIYDRNIGSLDRENAVIGEFDPESYDSCAKLIKAMYEAISIRYNCNVQATKDDLVKLSVVPPLPVDENAKRIAGTDNQRNNPQKNKKPKLV